MFLGCVGLPCYVSRGSCLVLKLSEPHESRLYEATSFSQVWDLIATNLQNNRQDEDKIHLCESSPGPVPTGRETLSNSWVWHKASSEPQVNEETLLFPLTLAMKRGLGSADMYLFYEITRVKL